jgi:hypothetical protein
VVNIAQLSLLFKYLEMSEVFIIKTRYLFFDVSVITLIFVLFNHMRFVVTLVNLMYLYIFSA